MSRIVLILAVWVFLAALVAGVACLARVGRESKLGPPILRFSPSATSGSSVRVSVMPGASMPEPAPASSVAEPATTIAAPTHQPAPSAKMVAQDPAPAPPNPAPAPAPKKPARPDPADEGNDGSNGGLGRLPKGVPPEYEGLGVTCVSAATGRPITDVKVRSLTQKELDEWAQRNPGKSVEDEDPEMVLAASSTNVKTSVYGVAIAPSGPGKMLVDAKLGVLYAYAWVDRNKSSQVKLEMVEDRDVVFQTRGEDGSPRAGIPIVVQEGRNCREIWRGTTAGDDASVRMRHAAFLIERDAKLEGAMARIEGVWSSYSPMVGLPRLQLPVEPLTITLPPARSLRVRVKDPEGELVRIPVEITLRPKRSDFRRSCFDSATRTTREGEAVFERIEVKSAQPRAYVDHPSELMLEVDGGGFFESIDRPFTLGGEPDVELVLVRRPISRMKVVDAEDKPLAASPLAVWADTSNRLAEPCPLNGGNLVTGADGSLRVPLTLEQAGPDARSRRILLVQSDAEGNTIASASMPLGRDRQPGERDAGTVKMAELPVLAQGYVVDDREAAVANARVRVTADVAPGPNGVPADMRWVAVSDHAGFFKLRGEVGGDRLSLMVSAPDKALPPVTVVQRGDKKVKLVLARTSTLVTKVLPPAGVLSHWISVQIETGGEIRPMNPGGNDIHRAVGLVPGPLKMEVFIRNPDVLGAPGEMVFSVADVEVKPGVEVSDTRVNVIDLRSSMLWISLHVTDSTGTELNAGTVDVIEAVDGEPKRRSVPIRAGYARFAMRPAVVDVEINMPGFKKRLLKDVDKDADVQLVREK